MNPPECCDEQMELTQSDQVWLCRECGLTMDLVVWSTDPPELIDEFDDYGNRKLKRAGQ